MDKKIEEMFKENLLMNFDQIKAQYDQLENGNYEVATDLAITILNSKNTCNNFEYKNKYTEEALRIANLAIENGNDEAYWILTYTDNGKYLECLEKAAKAGQRDALYQYGNLILYPSNIVKTNKNKAIHYFTMAANKGNAEAAFKLGDIYYDGFFVDKDIDKAIKCYEIGLKNEYNYSVKEKLYALKQERGIKAPDNYDLAALREALKSAISMHSFADDGIDEDEDDIEYLRRSAIKEVDTSSDEKILKGAINFKININKYLIVKDTLENSNYTLTDSNEDYELVDDYSELDENENFYIKNNVLIEYLGKDSNVEIPEGITEIGNKSFNNNKVLTSITIPNNVIKIGDCAFQYCENLSTVNMSNSVIEIGKNAFNRCSKLYELNLSNNLKTIGKGAFCCCRNIKSLNLPVSVVKIAEEAFIGCEKLTSFTIPDGITEICNYTFGGCNNLASINIPNSVTKIGDYAFENCWSLKELTVP